MVHASAGGVGQWLIQFCKLPGTNVIGMTSSKNKREISLSLGAEVTFLYWEDWKSKIFKLSEVKKPMSFWRTDRVQER